VYFYNTTIQGEKSKKLFSITIPSLRCREPLAVLLAELAQDTQLEFEKLGVVFEEVGFFRLKSISSRDVLDLYHPYGSKESPIILVSRIHSFCESLLYIYLRYEFELQWPRIFLLLCVAEQHGKYLRAT
jgi:hypothetical protein